MSEPIEVDVRILQQSFEPDESYRLKFPAVPRVGETVVLEGPEFYDPNQGSSAWDDGGVKCGQIQFEVSAVYWHEWPSEPNAVGNVTIELVLPARGFDLACSCSPVERRQYPLVKSEVVGGVVTGECPNCGRTRYEVPPKAEHEE